MLGHSARSNELILGRLIGLLVGTALENKKETDPAHYFSIQQVGEIVRKELVHKDGNVMVKVVPSFTKEDTSISALWD